MKTFKLLIIILLSIFFIKCKSEKKNLFSINESKIKLINTNSDQILLTVTNQKSKKIDSVVYFSNKAKLGKSLRNETFTYNLSQETLGYKNIEAAVFFENDSTITQTRVEVVSNIEPELVSYKIVNTYPHDIKAYTQGLEFYNGFLYEGTGNGAGNGTGVRGISSIRKVDFKTGKVLQKIELPETIFGEGITILKGKIYQLTYKNKEGYVYDASTLKKEKTIPYYKSMEGWGLTNNGQNLYMTDGTEVIHIINPTDFSSISNLYVYTGAKKVEAINELEWVNDKIYCNIYTKDAIAILNPKNGAIEKVVNFANLKQKVTQHPDLDEFNGIAYNPNTKTFFITGKNWDKVFEVQIFDE